MADLTVEATAIPGLLVVRMPVHRDPRGWFKENWQRATMTALGLPDFGPVQNNVSYNVSRGATRGIHAEPWDKLVSVATGRVFGAWVDLREGGSFGTTVTVEIDESVAVYVPRGVGNSYQALEDGTAYTYLVNDHYVAGRTYPALALDDPDAAIDWPIPLSESEISAKDRINPRLGSVTPFAPRRPLVLGAGGQVGQALLRHLPGAVGLRSSDLDITDDAALEAYDWSQHDLVVNAAAMTAVDEAESPKGRRRAWATNATAAASLARLSVTHRFTLVHYSTDYVYDGVVPEHDEREALAPLGVYGQSKAAGDLAISVAPRHYVLRTSWVIGDGANFVRTMVRLADSGVSPSVVDDQHGRLTFADDLAAATAHLVASQAPFGVYHCTSAGDLMTWADIAREVFLARGRPAADVTGVSTDEYAAGRAMSPRPTHSGLSVAALRATGHEPVDQRVALADYLSRLDPPAPAVVEPAATAPVRIITVCTGNICRSPYAERLLAHRLEQVRPGAFEVTSAGVGALVGDPMDPESARLLGATGLRHDDFVARQVSEPMLEAADLALPLTAEHRSALLSYVPRLVRRSFTIKEMARLIEAVDARGGWSELLAARTSPRERWTQIPLVLARERGRSPVPAGTDDIADPYRRGPEHFDVMAEEIAAAVEVIVGLEARFD